MRKIKRIFVHCTAGSQRQSIDDLKTEFVRKGWKYPGYHYVVDINGGIHQLLAIEQVSNGVQGYNSSAINVAYMGGIDSHDKPIDNRTPAQKDALTLLLHRLKQQFPDVQILGHRDISPDKNHNGIVDPWERIKECPCFDAIPEYRDV